MRLDRLLSEMGVASRREIRELCRRGRVTVNGVVVKKPDAAVNAVSDMICLDGEEIRYEEYSYIMLHKPAGVITAVTDAREKTVMDLLTGRVRKDLAPVGRLDKDTEGLLILTNDGEFARHLLSPKHHVPKTYLAVLDREPDPAWVTVFAEGIDIGDEKPAAPAKLVIPGGGESVTPAKPDILQEYGGLSLNAGLRKENTALLTITEGRFHQVKRMFAAVGAHVVYLKRLCIGGLVLDSGLAPGEYRQLTAEETAQLKI